VHELCADRDHDDNLPMRGDPKQLDADAFLSGGQSRPDRCRHAYTWADDGKGHSGSVCTLCGQPEPNGVAPADMDADAFLSGEQPDEPAFETPEFNVSGQPAAEYEWRGNTNMGYLVKDPETGDFRRYKNGKPRGWTRVTTFNKAASDSNALTAWGKRNVLIGACLRPGVVAKAHGWTHEDNKRDLDSMVAELEDVAGAKVSADWGTVVHELTERMDGDPEFSMDDVAELYRGPLRLYAAALKEAQLIPVRGLIERTTLVQDFGGVVGTLDRVYLHVPSGQYLIGDVKTGKTLDYGMDEIETQEAIYARGVNANGVYDWNTDTWEPLRLHDGARVSEDWGVVVHLPAQGKDKGTCRVVEADLQRGWRHAQVCHDVRVQRSNKPKPVLFTGERLFAVQNPAWDTLFASVRTNEEATVQWRAAKTAGIAGPELVRLVAIAREALARQG
jgi:hypothetical protein